MLSRSEDPKTWAKPWGGEYEIHPNPLPPGIYNRLPETTTRRGNILAGAPRAEHAQPSLRSPNGRPCTRPGAKDGGPCPPVSGTDDCGAPISFSVIAQCLPCLGFFAAPPLVANPKPRWSPSPTRPGRLRASQLTGCDVSRRSRSPRPRLASPSVGGPRSRSAKCQRRAAAPAAFSPPATRLKDLPVLQRLNAARAPSPARRLPSWV